MVAATQHGQHDDQCQRDFQTWVGVEPGIIGVRFAFGHDASNPLTSRRRSPLVAPAGRHTEHPADFGHVAGLDRVSNYPNALVIHGLFCGQLVVPAGICEKNHSCRPPDPPLGGSITPTSGQVRLVQTEWMTSRSGLTRAHHPRRVSLRRRGYFKRPGPGIVTGAADDDPSGIGPYSQVGAAQVR